MFPNLILFQQVFLALNFPRVFRVWIFLKVGLNSKERGTKYLSLPISFDLRSSVPFNSRPTCYLVYVHLGTILIALYCQIQMCMDWRF